jgi:hypothetical protein
MLINIQDIWHADVLRAHDEYVSEIIDKAVVAPGSYIDVLIRRHRNHFAIHEPNQLRLIIESVKDMTSSACQATYQEFLEDCRKIFNYGKFSDKSKKGWNAFQLCASSMYQMCPYCQQAGALTVYRESDTQAFRPTLDHFYPKAQYPFLGLSLYNLIPSCHSCNSSLKTTADFYEEEHLHPFEDGELIRYEWDVEQYLRNREAIGPIGGSLELNGVSIQSIPAGHIKSTSIKNSISTFLIEERLNLNLMSLRRFQDTLLYYSPERLAETNAKILSPSGWTLTEDQALQFSYKDYKNEWFGRLKADLYDATWARI